MTVLPLGFVGDVLFSSRFPSVSVTIGVFIRNHLNNAPQCGYGLCSSVSMKPINWWRIAIVVRAAGVTSLLPGSPSDIVKSKETKLLSNTDLCSFRCATFILILTYINTYYC